MSRNLEIINEIIDLSVREDIPSLEGFCLACATRMLQMHEYASMAEVECACDYFLEKVTPAGKKTIENYSLEAWAGMERGGKARKSISVTAVGMSACPCAMENIRELICTERNILPKDMPDFP